MGINDTQIVEAVQLYPKRVTGAMSGCRHPEAVLRWALEHGGAVGKFAANYIQTGHGACWNAMCNVLPANGWLVWYAGGTAKH